MGGEDAAVYIAKWIEPQHTKARVLLPALQFFYSVKRNRFRRFADLAIFERSAAVPAAGRGAEVAFEGTGKFGSAGETRLKRDVGNALFGRRLSRARPRVPGAPGGRGHSAFR